MNKLFKKPMKWLGLYKEPKPKPKKEPPPIPAGSTVLIHIGKCGGRTVRDGIQHAEKNRIDHEVHRNKPIYRQDLKYIVVARGPISRLSSAFRWRYKLVVSEEQQKDRFEGEYEVLIKYKTLNTIAEALYDERGMANITAQEDIRKIHHIYEDIAFHLSDLLSQCHPDQIIAVLMQENLDEDIFRVFGYRNELNLHRNPGTEKDDGLTDQALSNLMRFFEEDYQVLTKLYCWGKIDRDVLAKAL